MNGGLHLVLKEVFTSMTTSAFAHFFETLQCRTTDRIFVGFLYRIKVEKRINCWVHRQTADSRHNSLVNVAFRFPSPRPSFLLSTSMILDIPWFAFPRPVPSVLVVKQRLYLKVLQCKANIPSPSLWAFGFRCYHRWSAVAAHFRRAVCPPRI